MIPDENIIIMDCFGCTVFATAVCRGSKNIVRFNNVPVLAGTVEDIIITDLFELMPVFDSNTSGINLGKYISENLRYPLPELDCPGCVFVQFIIETDGTVNNENVICNGLHPMLDT